MTARLGWTLLLAPPSRALALEELDGGRATARRLAQLTALMFLGGAAYGAVLGSWRGGLQSSYAALKLPLVLVVTSALTLPFNWIAATILGARLTIAHAAGLTFFALATASIVLGSLAPVALLFIQSAPEPSPEARTAHNILYLLHTGIVGGAGLVGMLALGGALRARAARRAARRVLLAWVLCFALVGGEVAWVFRPFVGSVHMRIAFLRDNALEGNVYENVVTDIAPHLLGILRGEAAPRNEGGTP